VQAELTSVFLWRNWKGDSRIRALKVVVEKRKIFYVSIHISVHCSFLVSSRTSWLELEV
jgi:hypothetical protein